MGKGARARWGGLRVVTGGCSAVCVGEQLESVAPENRVFPDVRR